MAVDTQKFLALPPAKKGGDLVPNLKSKKSGGNLISIKTKIVKATDILKGTLAAEKKALSDKKRAEEKAKRGQKEKELESPEAKKAGIKMPKMPKMSWLARIKKFINTIIFGWIAVRLLKFLPQLVKLLKPLAAIADFILKVGGMILNTLITFVDWGYKAYEWTRDAVGKVFGPKGAETFDKISGVLTKVLNLTMTLALGIIALSNEWDNQRDPNDRRRDRTKTDNRRIRNRTGTQRRTGPQHEAEVKRRLGNRRRIIRNRRLNRIRRLFNQPEVRPKLDTQRDPLGTRRQPVPETKVRTNVPEKPNIFQRIRESGYTPPKRTITPRGPNFLQRAWSTTTEYVEGGIQNTRRAATWVKKGTISNVRATSAWINDKVIDPLYRNTIGKVDDWLKENLDPKVIIKKLADEGGDGILPKIARGIIGMADSPLMKGIMRGLPFLGDAIFFITDIASGKHWLRAFLRMLGAALIDAGFYALLAALGIAAPFTAGTSLLGSAALIAAYMAADAVAGSALGGDAGVGQVIGDKIADYFGVPQNAGEKGPKDSMWENAFGKGSGSSNKIIAAVDKVQLTQEQIAKISKFPGGLGVPPTKDTLAGITTSNTNGELPNGAGITPISVAGVKKNNNEVIDGVSKSASYEDGDGSKTIIVTPEGSSSGEVPSFAKETVVDGNLVILGSNALSGDNEASELLYKNG